MSFAVAAAPERSRAYPVSMALSVVLHVGLVAAFLTLRPDTPLTSPPVYRVDLIAAAPGPSAAGLAAPQLATPVEPDKPLPARPKSDEAVQVKVKTTPTPAPRLATPNVSPKRVDRAAPAPVAAGGDEGGQGTDVKNIKTEGIDFPFPGYLDNIVRQIALRFQPPRGRQLTAEVTFLIRRDGTIAGLTFVKRSGDFRFDLEAQGAVEATAGRFGPLPAGFRDDVLPVWFSFDPKLIR